MKEKSYGKEVLEYKRDENKRKESRNKERRK